MHYKIFSNLKNKFFFTGKAHIALSRGAASNGTPLDDSFYINTWLFWWGFELHHPPLSTLSCQWAVPIHALNSHSLIVLPCIVAQCELISSYCCWHQLFLPLASGFLKHCSDIKQQYPKSWNFFFCLPISGVFAKTTGTLSSSETKTHCQCVGYVTIVFCYIYQAWKILLAVVKLPLISWLGHSRVTRAVDLLDNWEVLQSETWNSKCLLLLSLQSTKTLHPGTLMCFQNWSKNGSCWANLSLPNSTHMTCQGRVLVPSNPVTLLF